MIKFLNFSQENKEKISRNMIGIENLDSNKFEIVLGKYDFNAQKV